MQRLPAMRPYLAHDFNYNSGGSWELLLNNTGVVAMHMTLTHQNTVIIFDQTRTGRSGYHLHSTKECAYNDDDDDGDSTTCWAHSVEYDIKSNTIRPLHLRSDTWCSSGSFLSDGTLMQTGGHGDGIRKIRYFSPCPNRICDWKESSTQLVDNRWYATNQILPEQDKVFVLGGLKAFSYEFIPKSSTDESSFELPLLRQTNNRDEKGDNLYPFIHLSTDGHLFIFANRDSILFDYHTHKVVRNFPTMPGNARNYPSTGSSVMLPLDYADGFNKVEIMVCGGGASGVYQATQDDSYPKAQTSCGRIVITAESPAWTIDQMPGPRVMTDMIILPNADILLINGATRGCAGWNNANNPSYHPFLYHPYKNHPKRFRVLNPSTIARMYHSSAVLVPDGRVLVAGSNPFNKYTFRDVDYPTELRMEAFSPHYLDSKFDSKRAIKIALSKTDGIRYGEEFGVQFWLRNVTAVKFYVYAPPFATHSFSMNQRMIKVECVKMDGSDNGVHKAVLKAPPNSVIAPAGYYMITVVNGRIPSSSEWIRSAWLQPKTQTKNHVLVITNPSRSLTYWLQPNYLFKILYLPRLPTYK